jgi:dihydroorotate dehydrogenase electron transfer subunit
MGCGIGACLVCACKTKKDGHEQYSHVCKNGPVFSAEEVVWDD